MTRTVDITLDEGLATEIENRAVAMHLTSEKYVQLILLESVERNSDPNLLMQKQQQVSLPENPT